MVTFSFLKLGKLNTNTLFRWRERKGMDLSDEKSSVWITNGERDGFEGY